MNEERFSVPCDSRCVDGMLRGAMIGFTWSLYVPMTVNGSSSQIHTRPYFRITTKVLGSLRVAGLFGSFFGILNMFTCLSEKFRGRQDQYNSLIGGCITGSLAALPTRNPTMVLGAGLTCGLLGSAIGSLADNRPSKEQTKTTLL